jgi:hypothetical protein
VAIEGTLITIDQEIKIKDSVVLNEKIVNTVIAEGGQNLLLNKEIQDMIIQIQDTKNHLDIVEVILEIYKKK